MQFHSTRQDPNTSAVRSGFAQALLKGLAPDGGLYVPQHWRCSSRRGFVPASDWRRESI